MIRYFLKSLGAHFRAGRTLFALSVFGVALGVASVLSIQIINRNALGAFEGSVRAISGDADLTVVSRTADLEETLYPAVLGHPGVVAARPVYRIDVALAGHDAFYLEIAGFDLFSPMQIPWEHAPVARAGPIERIGWAAVSTKLAERMGWSEGDEFEVTSGSRRVSLHVGARIDFARITPLASSRLVVMDISQAQGLFGGRGKLHQIDVELLPGTDPDSAIAALGERLGPSARVTTPTQRRNEAAGLLGAFRLNLTALSLISLFVGAFLVYSSTQASLVRRRNEFGLLRSLGMSRGRVFLLALGEVSLLGVLGVAIGIPLGYLAARANVDLVSATLSNLYLLEGIETLELPWTLYAMAAAIGLVGAIGGALVPALDISRRETRQLLVAYTLHEKMATYAGPLLLVGLGWIAFSGLAYLLFLRELRPGGFVLGVSLLIGLPLTAPFLVQQTTRHLRIRSFGLLYGVKALGLRIQVTAFAVAALAVAISMLFGITLMIGSFRRTVEIWLQSTLHADVYVTTESWRRARDAAALDPEIVRAIEGVEGVRTVDRLRQFFVDSGGGRIALSGIDMRLERDAPRFDLLHGEIEQARRRVAAEGQVLISEPLARKQGLAVGDRLRVAGPGGPLEYLVAGVFYDYSSERGGAAMDLTTMREAFGPGPVSNLALYLEPGVEPEVVIDRVKSRLPGVPLLIRSNADIKREVFVIFDQTFAVTRLLQAMSLVIAVCGITLTLIVLARERVSELALYRALGSRRGQIFRVFLGKGLGIAGFGLALGAVGGTALALILIFVINRAYFGWTIAVHWPWRSLVEGSLLILAASAAASLYPAFRASRTPAAELSRENL